MSQQKQKTLIEALADAFIETWETGLEKARKIRQAYRELPFGVRAGLQIPDIDLHVLEHDKAWRSYKKDKDGRCTYPAEEDHGAWIRIKDASNTTLRLVKAIKREGLEKVTLGLYEYKISGDFLQRRPLKKPEENDPHARMDRNISNVKEAGEKLTQSRGAQQ